jgi:peptide-methionine (S)-S-oxide reductase
MGGSKASPSYHSLGDHTETTQVEFDPTQTSYEQLLALFAQTHDMGRGAYSRQYMSVLFPHGEKQERAAREFIAARKSAGEAVATAVLPCEPTALTVAEGYHQKYTLRRFPDVLRALKLGSDTAVIDSPVAARLNGYLDGNGTGEALEREMASWGLEQPAVDAVRSAARRRGLL